MDGLCKYQRHYTLCGRNTCHVMLRDQLDEYTIATNNLLYIWKVFLVGICGGYFCRTLLLKSEVS